MISELNGLAQTYQPLINAFTGVVGIFISIGLFGVAIATYKLSKQGNKSLEQRIDEQEKQIFREVYEQLNKALGLVFQYGNVTDEAHAIFWKARDKTRLELPEDIQHYTQEVFDLMHGAWIIEKGSLKSPENGGLPISKDREAKVKEHSRLINELLEKKPYKIFSPYLRVRK